MSHREYLNVLGWDAVHCDVYALAGQIEQAGLRPDLIVGIGQGGVIPSSLLYFALPETKFRVVVPSGSATEFDVPLERIGGKHILLVDDLAITGDSLQEIRKHIADQGAAKVTTACLYASRDYQHIDFVIRRLEPGERIVFPWYCSPWDGSMRVYKYRDRYGKHEPMD